MVLLNNSTPMQRWRQGGNLSQDLFFCLDLVEPAVCDTDTLQEHMKLGYTNQIELD